MDTGAQGSLHINISSDWGPGPSDSVGTLIMVKQVFMHELINGSLLQAVIIFYAKIKLSHKETKCLPRLRLFVCLSPRLEGPDPVKYKHRLWVLHVTVRMGPGQVHAIIFIGGWVLCCVVLVLQKPNPFISAGLARAWGEVRGGGGVCVVQTQTKHLRRYAEILSVTRYKCVTALQGHVTSRSGRIHPQIVTTQRVSDNRFNSMFLIRDLEQQQTQLRTESTLKSCENVSGWAVTLV